MKKLTVLIMLVFMMLCGKKTLVHCASAQGDAAGQSAQDSWICPTCGHDSRGSFCSYCGEKKPDPLFCPVCGVEYAADCRANFCSNCGAALSVKIPDYPEELAGKAKKKEVTPANLPCSANQNIVPFRDGLLYSDGETLYHVSGSGEIRWSCPGEQDMKYIAGPTNIAAWNDARLMLIDCDGNVTYSDRPDGGVQFVRMGEQYAAIVTGSETSPKLSIRNMEGGQEDVISDLCNNGRMLLDAGFFGDGGRYLWTLAVDAWGSAYNTILNTYAVGRMNYGQVSLGEDLPYRIISGGGKLQAFTTQMVSTYDYRCIQDSSSTVAVYGWEPIDAEVQEQGKATVLLAPSGRASGEQIPMLRVLEGGRNWWYYLPSGCIGACLYKGNVYAVSGRAIYRVDQETGKISGYQISGLWTEEITQYIGHTSNGVLLAAVSDGCVCAIPLQNGTGTELYTADSPEITTEHYTGDCLIVRDETLYMADGLSDIDYIAGEGDEVTPGKLLCITYSTGFSAREKSNLQDYRDAIRELQTKLLEKETDPDTALEKLDNDLLVQVREARMIIHGGRGSLINVEKRLRDAVQARQNYLRNKYANNQRLVRMLDDEQSQMTRIASWTKQYTAQVHGIVSFYSDGYEHKLTVDHFDEFTPSEVHRIINGMKSSAALPQTGGTPVYRMVRDTPWYVLMLAGDTGWNPVEGAEYRLLLGNAESTAVNAKVVSCSRTNGDLLIRLLVYDAPVQPVLYTRTCPGKLIRLFVP